MGGGGDRASQQAQAQEQQRQAQIRATTDAINRAFGDPKREAQIQDFLAANRTLYGQELNKQQGDAARELKFALARGGQTGGSVARDRGVDLGEAFQRGLITVERQSQGDAAQLRDADQQARLNLTAMAQSGLDTTTAAQNATSALRNNLLSSKAGVQADQIGQLFGGFSDLFRKSKEDAEYRRGLRDTRAPLYAPGAWGASTTNPNRGPIF